MVISATAFRFEIIGFLLSAYHPERLVAFAAARYVVTDRQPDTKVTENHLLRLSIFAGVIKQAGGSQKSFWLSAPSNPSSPNRAVLHVIALFWGLNQQRL
jgi:hypothetical protein